MNHENEIYYNLEKRFQTTMIGALAKFEDAFGNLWGHNKHDNELTDKELDFRDLWERTRMLILNNGNHQMRSAISELTKHIRSKYRYNYKFYVKPNYPERGEDYEG
jgi:hypothetical protein